MRPRPFLWLRFRSKQGDPPPLEPSLAKEDEETRAGVNHYLRLADQALSTDEPDLSIEKDEGVA